MLAMLDEDTNTKYDGSSAETPKQRSCEAVRPYAGAARREVDNVKARLAQLDGGDDNSSKRLAFVDLHSSLLADNKGWRRFLCDDGAHLSPEGNKFLFHRLSDELTKVEGSPDNLPRHASHYFHVSIAFRE